MKCAPRLHRRDGTSCHHRGGGCSKAVAEPFIGQDPDPSSAEKGLAWALAAFVLVLTVGGLYFAFSGDDGQVVDQTTVPTPTTVPAPTTAGGMWPQSNLEEVREAQERADAGDPDYTWQLDEALAADGDPWGAEIFARFIAEELGWEDSSGFGGYAYGGGVYEEVVFIRCEPGSTNPLYPDAPRRLRPDDRRAQVRDGELQRDPAWP